MADTGSAASRGTSADGGTAGRSWKTWLVSAGLVAATLLLATACIFILSSVLGQGRLSSITIDGVNLSIRKLVSIGDQWKTTRTQIQTELQLRNSARNQRIDLSVRATNAKNDLSAKRAYLDELLQTLHRRVDATEPSIAAVNGKGYPDQIGAVQESQPQLHKDHPELDPFVDDIINAYRDYGAAERANASAAAQLQALDEQIKDLADRIDGDTKSLNSVFDLIKPGIDGASREKVENALYELFFNRQTLTQASGAFITMDPDNLTLLLVIMMGVLGSALQMTHAFVVRNQAITISGYLLRISLGAITALVMFIVAKAGVPVVTDASRFGGDAPINPHFVAFLAIVSGLLSESALANVQQQGEKLLGQGSAGPDRWARHDLTPQLEAQGLSIAALAAHLGVSEMAAAAMLEGEQKIDPEAQKLIAIYLRADMRDLFTDMPPPDK
jgi:lambda repressor-like predicted transcriptional regulator